MARQTVEGLPKSALMLNKELALKEALFAHTNGAAKSLSRLDIGTLEVGNYADFVNFIEKFLRRKSRRNFENNCRSDLYQW